MAKSPLEKVADAAGRIRAARNIVDACQLRLDKTVREADAAGVPKAEIARAAGLSRPTVYVILERARQSRA